MFGPKKIPCPAGQVTTVIRTYFAQMPKAWSVSLQTADGTPITGAYVESKSAWIFPGSSVRGTIHGTHTFERGYWNTFYVVRVTTDTDATAVVE